MKRCGDGPTRTSADGMFSGLSSQCRGWMLSMSEQVEGHWQVQEATQRFSEVLRAAERDGPQTITRHGQETAVVIDIDEYRRLVGPKQDLTEILLGPPYFDDDVISVLERVQADRKTDLPKGDRPRDRSVNYLLDTNVLSETRKRKRNPGVTGWLSTTPRERLHLSAITIGEIERGVTQLLGRGDHRQAADLEEWLGGVIQQFGARVVPRHPPGGPAVGPPEYGEAASRGQRAARRHSRGTWLDDGHPQHQGPRARRSSSAQPLHLTLCRQCRQ